MKRAVWRILAVMVLAAVMLNVEGCRASGGSPVSARAGPSDGDALVLAESPPALVEVGEPAVEDLPDLTALDALVDPPVGPAGKALVDLEQSFLIPRKADGSLSHTPAVVFTADGKRMITATSEGEIVVFDNATRDLLKRIRLPGEGADAVSIDKDGRYAAWALKKGGLVVLEIESGNVVARDDELKVENLAASPDGEHLALANGKDLEVRELLTLRCVVAVPGHAAQVTSVAWSADGRLLGSTDKDGQLVVFDFPARRTTYQAKKTSPLYAVAFHPGGGLVAYGGEEKRIYQYDLAAGREEVMSSDQQPYWITCLGYSPDGSHLAVGDESCDIWLYDVATKKQIFHNKHHVECWLGSIAWAGDNETFLFGCRPNSHAGKPAVYQFLTQVEAARSPEVRQSRGELLAAIDGELKSVSDPGQREVLIAYHKCLESEEGSMPAVQVALEYSEPQLSLNAAPVQSRSFFLAPQANFLEEVTGTQVALQAESGLSNLDSSSPPSIEKLPARLQELAKKHQETLKREVENLNSNYCLNQWKVQKTGTK